MESSKDVVETVRYELAQLRQVMEMCDRNAWLAQEQAMLRNQQDMMSIQNEIKGLKSLIASPSSESTCPVELKRPHSISLGDINGLKSASVSDFSQLSCEDRATPSKSILKRLKRPASWGAAAFKKARAQGEDQGMSSRVAWRALARCMRKWSQVVENNNQRKQIAALIEARVLEESHCGSRRALVGRSRKGSRPHVHEGERSSESQMGDPEISELMLPIVMVFVGMFCAMFGLSIPPAVAGILALCSMGELVRVLYQKFDSVVEAQAHTHVAKGKKRKSILNTSNVERVMEGVGAEFSELAKDVPAKPVGVEKDVSAKPVGVVLEKGQENVSDSDSGNCQSTEETSETYSDSVSSDSGGVGPYMETANIAMDSILSISRLEGNFALSKTTKSGISIYIRNAEGRNGNAKQVCGKARVAVSPFRMLTEVTNTDNWKLWDPMLKMVETWKIDGVKEAFPGCPEYMQVRLSLHGIFPVSARDMHYIQTVKKLDDESWVVCSRSLDADLAPERKNFVRAYLHSAGWRIEPVEGSPDECDVTYTLDIDIKMRMIPTTVMNMICTGFPEVIDKVRKGMGVHPSQTKGQPKNGGIFG